MRRLPALLLIILSVAAVAATAYAVDRVRTPRHTAEAVLVVPPGGEGSVTDGAGSAGDLAATYSQLLPREERLLDAMATAAGTSTAVAERGFRVRRPDPSGAVLRLSFSAPTASAATRGLRAVDRYLAHPPAATSAVIEPGSLRLVSRASGAALTPSGRFRSRATYVAAISSVGAPTDAFDANRLAGNYAGLLPDDMAVLRAGARRAGLPLDTVSNGLRVTNDLNTSVLRVSFTDEDYAKARRVVLGVARAVTGERPRSDRVVPRSLEIARLPDPSVSSGRRSSMTAIVGGALVGLVFGLMAVAAYNLRHPRLTSVERARDLLDLPVTAGASMTPELAVSLLARWTETGATQVVLVPESRRAERSAQALASALAEHDAAAGNAIAVSVRARAFADAFEPELPSASGRRTYDVLVVEQGRRFDGVRRTLGRYEALGGQVRWVMLGRARRAPTRARHDRSERVAA